MAAKRRFERFSQYDEQDPAEISIPFAADLVFEIQGDVGVLPWIGRKTGRQAIAKFIRDIRTLTEPVAFNVEDILASDSRAAIISALRTWIKATGKVAATQFAIYSERCVLVPALTGSPR